MKSVLRHFWLERTCGIILLFTGTMMFFRPYADALQTIPLLANTTSAPVLLGGFMLFFGALLVFLRETKLWVFMFLHLPFWTYNALLAWRFLNIYTVGILGTVAFATLWGYPVYLHITRKKRAFAVRDPSA